MHDRTHLEHKPEKLTSEDDIDEVIMRSWIFPAVFGVLLLGFGIGFALYTGGAWVGTFISAFGGALLISGVRLFLTRRR